MTQTTWAIERENASRKFGDTFPTTADEAEISQAFREHPAAVLIAVREIADGYANGRVHTPWKLLRSKLGKITSDSAPVEVNRDQRVRLAETWIRNAGLYEPSEESLLDALFGEHGRLRAWDGDETLRRRMVNLWRTEQPRGHHADQEKLERAQRWKTQHATTADNA